MGGRAVCVSKPDIPARQHQTGSPGARRLGAGGMAQPAWLWRSTRAAAQETGTKGSGSRRLRRRRSLGGGGAEKWRASGVCVFLLVAAKGQRKTLCWCGMYYGPGPCTKQGHHGPPVPFSKLMRLVDYRGCSVSPKPASWCCSPSDNIFSACWYDDGHEQPQDSFDAHFLTLVSSFCFHPFVCLLATQTSSRCYQQARGRGFFGARYRPVIIPCSIRLWLRLASFCPLYFSCLCPWVCRASRHGARP